MRPSLLKSPATFLTALALLLATMLPTGAQAGARAAQGKPHLGVKTLADVFSLGGFGLQVPDGTGGIWVRVRKFTSNPPLYGYDAADRLTGVLYPNGAANLYKLRGDGSRLEEKAFEGMTYGMPLGPEAFATTTGSLTKHIMNGIDARDGLNAIQDLVSGEIGSITQDAAGRMTHMSFEGVTRDMVWDAADRMVSISQNGQASFYSYDYRNWRTEKVTPLESVTYTWGVDDLVAEEATLPGQASLPVRTYLQGPRMGLVLGVDEAAGAQLFAHDALGSVVGRVDALGTTLSRYDAWGQTRAEFPQFLNGTNGTGFTGYQRDAETGLWMPHGVRNYLPGLHRFASADPLLGQIDHPLSLNVFSYVGHRPTRFTDPDGRLPMDGAPTDKFVDAQAKLRTSEAAACSSGNTAACGRLREQAKALAAVGIAAGLAAVGVGAATVASSAAFVALSARLTGAAFAFLIQWGGAGGAADAAQDMYAVADNGTACVISAAQGHPNAAACAGAVVAFGDLAQGNNPVSETLTANRRAKGLGFGQPETEDAAAGGSGRNDVRPNASPPAGPATPPRRSYDEETPSPALGGNPYHPDSVETRVRPEYRPNPAHDELSPLYNPRKDPEPMDAALVYESATRTGFGTWHGRGLHGWYRFFSDNAGGVHFSGIIPDADVPKSAK